MAESLRVEGLNTWVRNLERLGAEVADLEEWRRLVAREVEAAAEAVVPVKDGTLRGRIYPVVTRNKAVVVADTDYADVINYGWPAHGIEATGFLTDPANDEVPLVAALEAELEGLVRRIFG